MQIKIIFCLFMAQAVLVLSDVTQDPKAPSPKTSTSTTTTTTTTTSTTTESSPTTSPQPAPIPDIKPSNLKFNITQKDGTVCALFSFESSIVISTTSGNETIKKTYSLGLNTTLDDKRSMCDQNVTSLYLNINGNVSQVLMIGLHLKETRYFLDLFEVAIDAIKFKSNQTVTEKGVEKVKSYVCLNNPEIDLQSNASSQTKATLSMTNLKVDAFRTKEDGTELRQAVQCDLDFPVNDFVPLAVGCALISLVFIVLVAYIVGRKRARRQTYESV